MDEYQEDHPQCTGDKILLAAIDLISKKGFKAVTTKEIAASSQVSEMTVFRHFGCKRAILEKALDRFSYSNCMEHIFANKMQSDLYKDLLLISQVFHGGMHRNRKVLLVLMKEGSDAQDPNHIIASHPMQLKTQLVQYFTGMQALSKVISGDPEAMAISFIWMNWGSIVSRLMAHGDKLSEITEDQFIESSVNIFARGLTP